MTWHADARLLDRYARGEIDGAHAASVEAHLLSCADCRALMPADPGRLEAIWAEVVEAVDAPRPGPVERLLLWVGVRDHVARLMAATPSLRLSWFAGVGVVLALAVAGAHGVGGGRSPLPYLLVAPLLPLVGVALTYGPDVDPTYEIGSASPMRGLQLLLIRATAVIGTTMLLAGVAGLFLPRLDPTTALWLLPALGLTLGSLALSTLMSPLWATGVTAFGWIAMVVVGLPPLRRGPVSVGDVFAFRTTGQLVFALIGLAAVAVLARRREAFDIGRTT